MLRSSHGNAKWTWSPHEFAKECTDWRSFRHLTYDGIRSYVISAMESVKHTAPTIGEEGREARVYFDFRYPGSPRSVQEEIEILRREGLVTTYPWLGFYSRVTARGVDALVAPGVLWSKSPQESVITFMLAWRLGVSCVLCGEVSAGRGALTVDRRLADLWWAGDWCRMPEASDWNHRPFGRERVFLNPLCEGCVATNAYNPIQKMFTEMKEKLRR